MKVVITIMAVVLIIFCLFFLAGLWKPKNVKESKNIFNTKPCFEVKVVYWYTNDEDLERYQVVFTNNSWLTKTTIVDLWDGTSQFGYIWVNVNDYCGYKDETIHFAEKFHSYEDCINHNLAVKNEQKRLESLYKEQGFPTERPKKIKKEPEIKEIIFKSCK